MLMVGCIMISLLVNVEVDPNRVDQFITWIKEEAEDARTKEPGCRGFKVSQSQEKPNVFTLIELYDDEAALEAHRQTPHFLLFRERASDGLFLNKTSFLGTIIDG